MKRNARLILAVLLAAVLVLGLLAGCGNNNTNTNTPEDRTNTETEQNANTVSVCWYDGTKLLREDKVEKGSTLTSWTPTKDGSTFMEWYAEASKTQVFDFSKAVNEDTDIFAGWKGAFTADETVWCLIGSGAGTLKGSNWSEMPEVEETFKLTRQESDSANLFVMEGVILYEGDQFQIREMGTWTGQHGVGYMDGYTETSDGDIVGEVVVNGERWFYANGGFGDSPKGWNVNVAKSGVYTLTMETNPGSNDYDVIYFDRTGDAPELTMTHDMYIKGTMDGWAADEAYQMATDALREDFSFVLVVTEDMVNSEDASWTAGDETNPYGAAAAAMKVCNEISGTWYGVDEQDPDATSWTLSAAGANNLFLQPGQYNVSYNVGSDTATVSISEKGYFLAGVVNGGDHWDCTSGVEFQVVEGMAGQLVAYYTFTEDDTASWIRDAGKVGAVKAVYGFSGGTAVDYWYGTEEDQDNLMVDEYGLYRIILTFTGEGEGFITAEKVTGNFLVGTLADGEDWASRYSVPMDGDSVEYTWTEKAPANWLGADEIAAVKVITVNEDGSVDWFGTESGDNVMITEPGTYTITLSGGVVTATK